MVKLGAMLSQAIVDGLKGTIDLYLWKDIPCARKWPIYKPRMPYPGEAANQEDFAYINKTARTISPTLRQVYQRATVGTTYTWKDLLVLCYMAGIPYTIE